MNVKFVHPCSLLVRGHTSLTETNRHKSQPSFTGQLCSSVKPYLNKHTVTLQLFVLLLLATPLLSNLLSQTRSLTTGPRSPCAGSWRLIECHLCVLRIMVPWLECSVEGTGRTQIFFMISIKLQGQP